MIGVVILTYRSADVIEACLRSLWASEYTNIRTIVCDNNSPDETADIVRNWAACSQVSFVEKRASEATVSEHSQFTLLHTGGNLGFAGGVNAGLKFLMQDSEIDLFWILNPDCEVLPNTASVYADCAAKAGPFSLMGGRIYYLGPPRRIQSDGGRVFPWSGICESINSGKQDHEAVLPDVTSVDFITGANMVASRTFIERVGFMVEDYFLYYEEVDWAARRGELPLMLCPKAVVLHHGGTAIGTGTPSRRPSPFANYFNTRNRMRFMRRFRPFALPTAWSLSMLRVGKLLALGALDEAWAAFCGLNGLAPPNSVRERIAPEDQGRAFSPAQNRH